MLKSALTVTFLVASTLSVSAQDAAKLAAATAYADNPVQIEMIDTMLSPEGMMAQMAMIPGQIPPEVLDVIARIVSEEVGSIKPVIREAMIEAMAENFTLEEINALNAFYSSEVGASAMIKMNTYMQSAMQRIAPDMQEMQMRISQRIQQAFAK